MFSPVIGIYCIYRMLPTLTSIYLTMHSSILETTTWKLLSITGKSDFIISWQKCLLVGITIMSLHEQMVKVSSFTDSILCGSFIPEQPNQSTTQKRPSCLPEFGWQLYL